MEAIAFIAVFVLYAVCVVVADRVEYEKDRERRGIRDDD